MLIKIWSRQTGTGTGGGNIIDNIKRILEGLLSTKDATLVFDVLEDTVKITINGIQLTFALKPEISIGKVKIVKIAEKRYEVRYNPQASQSQIAPQDIVLLSILFYNLKDMYIKVQDKTIINFGILVAIVVMAIYFMAKK